jgi:hypothetical protein
MAVSSADLMSLLPIMAGGGDVLFRLRNCVSIAMAAGHPRWDRLFADKSKMPFGLKDALI